MDVSLYTRCLRRLGLLLMALALALPVPALAQVDINSADARTLAASLSGIGLVKAEAIVAYRDTNGPFTRAEDLLKVKGIGHKTLDANRQAIVVLSPPEHGPSTTRVPGVRPS